MSNRQKPADKDRRTAAENFIALSLNTFQYMNQSDICNTFLLHNFISSQTGECRHWNCEDASQADGSHGWQDELSPQSHSAGEDKYRKQFGHRNKPNHNNNNNNNNKKQKRELKQSDDNTFSDVQRRAFTEDASQKQMDDKMN